MGSEECYRCIYKRKIDLLRHRPKKCCSICKKPIWNRFRFTYCSQECADVGEIKVKNQRWASDYQGAPDYGF